MNKTFSERLIEALAQRGMTQAELARAVGLKQQAIQYLCDKDKNAKGSRKAHEIAQALKVNYPWLIYGNGPRDQLDIHPQSDIASNTAPATAPRQIPLISWVHAGEASEAIDNYPPGYAEEWVLAAGPLHANAYALRIVGDSMAPEFWPGQTIVIDPEADWRSGSYVIVKNGDNEVVLRQIVREIGGWMLIPANKAYPPVPLGSYHVIGVVRWSQKQYL